MTHQQCARPRTHATPRSFAVRSALLIFAIVCGGTPPAFSDREPCLLVKSSRQPMKATGTARIAVIMVDFPGVPSTYTTADVVSGLRDRQPGSPFSAFEVFAQSSRGRYQIDFGTRSNNQPAVFGPYLVDKSPAERCAKGYKEWSKRAAVIAATDGYKRKRFNHTVFLFPPRSTIGCGLTGIGEVGGDTTWLFGLSANAFTHELGHNLGLFHSGRRDQTGLAAQYGDLSSPMGSFQHETLLFSAPHRSQLGWIPPAETETIPAGTTGRRTLVALERQRDATLGRVISIPLSDGSSYKLSYRQELPEAPSSRSRRYVAGLTIHRDFGLGLTTKLIAVLRDGESFIDETNNVTITQSHHVAQSVTFDLSGAPPQNPFAKGCYLIDPCTASSEGRTPMALDCRGYVAPVSPYQFTLRGRCPNRAPGEDNDLDGVADTEVQTADADGDGVPNEEDCGPTSYATHRLFRYTDIDSDGAYENTLPTSQGVCGGPGSPTNHLDESPRDSCPIMSDPAQTDNDRDGIGDICQTDDLNAASRRRILPSLQQLARTAIALRRTPAASAPELAKATSNAIKAILTTFSAEPALANDTKAALNKSAKQLAKPGAEKADAQNLSKILTSFGL